MINSSKIGVGIITYNRPDNFWKLFRSVESNGDVDHVCVVNDGDVREDYDSLINYDKVDIYQNQEIFGKNIGVGKSKNIAIRSLLKSECDYIFLIEDDIFIKRNDVFRKYIETSEKTGIQHLNYSQHGVMNKLPNGEPNPRTVIEYNSIGLKLPLYLHCVGAFSFYTKRCLHDVGLLDERYYNACEHVDHTLEIIKAGMHPPFWTFPDIENSWEYLYDEQWSLDQSTISGKPGHDNIVSFADEVFKMKHGCTPGYIPVASWDTVTDSLKQIKKTYASK